MSKSKEFVLCLDRGQTNVKAALFDPALRQAAAVSSPCPPLLSPRSGWCEQDMDQIWGAAVSAVRALLAVAPAGAKILAVSFAGQGGGTFPIDAGGRPLRNAILSMDARVQAQAAAFRREHPQLFTSAYFDLNTYFRLLWMRENEPEGFRRLRWVFGSKDWIRYKMCGVCCCDTTDHPGITEDFGAKYDRKWLKLTGLGEQLDVFPPVRRADEICGAVTKKAAEETGIPPGTPVAVGAHDMMAASLGAGDAETGALSVLMGTMGICIAAVDRQSPLPDGARLSAAVSPDHLVSTLSIGWGLRAYDWYLRMLYPRETAGGLEDAFYTALDGRLAAREPPALAVYPQLMGGLDDASLRSSVIGLTARTTRDDILRALLQGIVIQMSRNIQKMDAAFGVPRITLTGGGAKSALVGRLFSDVLQREVFVAETPEVCCRGAALCALAALGYYPSVSAAPPPAIKTVYAPDASRAGFYTELASLYESAQKHLKEIYRTQTFLEQY